MRKIRLAIYSDIHTQVLVYPNQRPDFVLLLGDIDWRDVKNLNKHFNSNYEQTVPIIGVLGNHDVLDTYRNTDVIDIHKKKIEINGVLFGGFGGCPRYNNKSNSAQYDEWEAQKYTRDMNKVDLFLAHSNPVFERDNDYTNAHRGFESFNELLDDKKCKYFFHGHIHENNEYNYNGITIISTYGFREYVI